MQLPRQPLRGRDLQTLVENQTTYGLRDAELHLFETHTVAAGVKLDFDHPVLATMLRGKKVMHLRQRPGFEFVPGESIMLPAEELMTIDFPEATMEDPTKCLALTIDDERIRRVVALMNERRPKTDNGEWTFTDYNFHFLNNVAIHQIIQRLIFLCAEDHESKDIFVDMMLQELLIRILETESREMKLITAQTNAGHDRLAYVLTFIRNHLSAKLSVRELSKRAYMSETQFYQAFKNEMGCSPVEFINQERLKLAANLLQNSPASIGEISARCGFNSVSYFTRIFKRHFRQSPSSYRHKRLG
ncbi:AraC family transcriptional regulator [Lewinella sp. W8]|uniref:AraC family transcriptional regulator n=1 Tax=Lewinella sp. W8 TaxID=2528208 RepID=UPI0010688B88|nr:AraC family transcriptional regulator [Lewinella sp. W8]MTB50958.1 helix-turn-helix domain-containing protein [Lewinella sp. W8]